MSCDQISRLTGYNYPESHSGESTGSISKSPPEPSHFMSEDKLETETWKSPSSKTSYKPRRRVFIHDWKTCRVPGGGQRTLWAGQTIPRFSNESVQSSTPSVPSLQPPSPKTRSSALQLPRASATLYPPHVHVTPRVIRSRNPNPIDPHNICKDSERFSLIAPHQHQTVTMPREVSDIKQFIEICRRKDASCTCR